MHVRRAGRQELIGDLRRRRAGARSAIAPARAHGAVLVLEGEATFTDGKDERAVGPGGVVIAPPGHPHGFVNSGTGSLRQIDVHLGPRFATEWLER